MKSSVIGILMEYEDILLGKKKDFSPAYLRQNASTEDAEELLRYVFGSLLGWDPSMVRDYTTKELLAKLHLLRPYRHLHFPPELDREKDIFYLGHLLYPEEVRYSKSGRTVHIFEKVLSREKTKFPKGFFTGEEGRLNLIICMKYILNHYFNFRSQYDMYAYFADRKKASRFLRDFRLTVPCGEMFGDALSFLHESLPEEEKSELYYTYFLFSDELRKYKESLEVGKEADGK